MNGRVGPAGSAAIDPKATNSLKCLLQNRPALRRTVHAANIVDLASHDRDRRLSRAGVVDHVGRRNRIWHGRADESYASTTDRFDGTDYIGQLDDDLADLIATIRPEHANAALTLIG